MEEYKKDDRGRSKAKRLTAADPHTKVDSSTWTPPEAENAGVKTGARPLTKRLYKKGGKVVGKHEGKESHKHGGRMPRKSGGRATSLTPDSLINRDVRMANDVREGTKHVGAFKKGGRVHKLSGGVLGDYLDKAWDDVHNTEGTMQSRLSKRDPKDRKDRQIGEDRIARRMRGIEMAENKLRLKNQGFGKGGKAHKLGGGIIGNNPVSAQNQSMGKAAGMMKKGGRAHRDDGGPVPVPPRKGDKNYNPYPYRPAAKNPNNPPKQPAYVSGEGYVNQNPEGYKKGGKAEKWIQGAIKHPGSLHKALHVPAGEKIPEKKLHAAEKKGGKLAKKAHLAETLKHMHHAKGGKASRHPDEAEDKRLIKKMVKPSALEHKKQGGGVFFGDSKKKIPGDTGGRQARYAGGRLHREGGGRNRDPDDNTAMPMATYNFLTGWSDLDKATPDQIAHMNPQDRQRALAAQGPSRAVVPAHSAAPRKMVGSGRGVAGPTADQIRSAFNSPAPSDAQQQSMKGRAQPAMTTEYGLYGPQTANDAAINFSRQVPDQSAQPVWHYSDDTSNSSSAPAPASAPAGYVAPNVPAPLWARGGRAQHAKGGRTKGKTQVNIIIGAGHGHQQPQGMMGGAPMPNAPVNPQRLPQQQPSMPPMGPQGAPPMPPQAMPMARKSGGRTGYPIETGSGGGEARLDKIKAYGLKGRK
jgi:hypothetical protein